MKPAPVRKLLKRKHGPPHAILLLCVVLFSFLFSGCSIEPLASWLNRSPQTTPGVETPVLPTPTPQKTPTAVPPDVTRPMEITLWVPPEMDPSNGRSSAMLFQAQIDDFASQNADIEVRVRVKDSSGPGSLIESLSAATVAATQAVPSLVALPRSDLETAALKGLIYPIDDLSTLMDDSDWYPYARELAVISDSTFGLPFGGDSLLLVYRPERVGIEPDDWYSMLSLGRPIIFPAGDPQASATLALYQSAGGAVQNAQRRPVLQANVLVDVLNLYSDGARQGAFPPWIGQLQTDEQAWQAYEEQRANLLVTWSSRYLTTLPVDSNAAPLPSLGDQEFSLAAGWVWAVSDPDPERRAVAVRLAEHLVESEFLSGWNAASGLLPPRPVSLENWPNQSLRSLIEPLVLSMQVRPSNDIAASLGPVLQDAALDVIRNQVEPSSAAEAAADQLNIQ
jgi:multiple sugar transport system substrate-binding protein